MILGIDIGGTNIKFGVTDENFNVVKKLTLPTNAHLGIDCVVNTVLEGAKLLMNDVPYNKIGIGTLGKIDCERGLLVSSANIPYHNTPIVKILSDALRTPVILGNDASCATIAEAYAGHGKQYKNFVMLTLGTGVGGGIVIDGKPYRGAHGMAGEFGHISVNINGDMCRCGMRGCLENYASVSALIKMTKDVARKHEDSLLANRIRTHGLDGKTAFDAQSNGCPIAKEVIREFTSNIALGLINYQRIFDPDAIVLGGAITAEGDALLTPIKEAANLPCPVLISALGADVGIIGAAVLATID
jgi:glucokinase